MEQLDIQFPISIYTSNYPILSFLRVWMHRSFSTTIHRDAHKGGHVCLTARPCISAGRKPVYPCLLGSTDHQRNGRHLSCWGLVLICPTSSSLLVFPHARPPARARARCSLCPHARHCMACLPVPTPVHDVATKSIPFLATSPGKDRVVLVYSDKIEVRTKVINISFVNTFLSFFAIFLKIRAKGAKDLLHAACIEVMRAWDLYNNICKI